MAFKLPLREDFESWTTSQIADLFKQCGMQECTGVLEQLGLNGYSFLNMTDHELNKFNILYQPHLQKMVSDLKKSETGLLQRIKKFQNDQVALICKTGKDTWDRLKSKPAPPTVPSRDYQTGPTGGEDDEWLDEFGSDYDSPDEHLDTETYVVPIEDDNYEPPPNENHVTPSFKIMAGTNGYADKPKTEPMNMHMKQPPKPLFPKHHQHLPPVTSRLHTENKPMPSPRLQPMSLPPSQIFRKPASLPQQDCDDEENYIVPEPENYVEPTKDPVKKHLYVVPENEDEDEYTVCEELDRTLEPPIKPKPSPFPRNMSKPLAQKPTLIPALPKRVVNSNVDKPQVLQRQRIPSAGTEPPPLPPIAHKLPVPPPKPNVIPIQKPPEVATRHISGPSRHGGIVEKDADVLNKEWYVSSCDRRKAEDALTATSTDGSFLVRKSSGQDSNQPFTLVVFYNRRVYNIPVRYIEATRQYALGREKSGEEKFHSVAEIIENHRHTPLVLIDSHNNTKDSTKLKQAVGIPLAICRTATSQGKCYKPTREATKEKWK
ncbi:B-cell linker protein isoform X2 [Rhinoderma darwinii]|uniref:B-cell linker protein isoform X2 n=1 Tax=Rhinoderma darwinii TaxID=43563 RepID=UPI003F681243